MAKVLPSWPAPKAFHDKTLEAQRNRNYPKFATDAFVELYRYAGRIREQLSFVHCPALIIHSKKDQVIDAKAAIEIHEGIASKKKRLQWFERSGHEMLLDMEAEAVTRAIADFLQEQQTSSTNE